VPLGGFHRLDSFPRRHSRNGEGKPVGLFNQSLEKISLPNDGIRTCHEQWYVWLVQSVGGGGSGQELATGNWRCGRSIPTHTSVDSWTVADIRELDPRVALTHWTNSMSTFPTILVGVSGKGSLLRRGIAFPQFRRLSLSRICIGIATMLFNEEGVNSGRSSCTFSPKPSQHMVSFSNNLRGRLFSSEFPSRIGRNLR